MVFMCSSVIHAQEDVESQAKELLKFYEGSLNFLGSKESPLPEKLIVINESYSKIFISPNVQIEDDLTSGRLSVLYKDVQAYLKDVDFFFQEVRFSYDVSEYEMLVGEDGGKIIKLDCQRSINGMNAQGDSLNNVRRVFVEMNANQKSGGLKIASIYSTRPDESDRPLNWWTSLNEDWRHFFAQNQWVCDSIPLEKVLWFSDSLIVSWHDTAQLEKVRKYESTGYDTIWYFELDSVHHQVIDSLFCNKNLPVDAVQLFLKQTNIDRAGDSSLKSLEPLSELRELQELNVAYTVVQSVFPLRNLNALEELYADYTEIQSLSPLRYCSNLRKLFFNNAPLLSLQGVLSLNKLECLHLNSPYIADYDSLFLLPSLRMLSLEGAPLFQLAPVFCKQSALEELNLSNTSLKRLPSLDSANNLKILNISSTYIRSLEPLSRMHSLEVLWCDSTEITDLEPLKDLQNLRRIYCDASGITKKQALAFMENKPECMVIFESGALETWWNELDDHWKELLMNAAGLSSPVDKEALHTIAALTHLEIMDNQYITDLKPLQKCSVLRELNVSGCKISDVKPLSELLKLESIDISKTEVEELAPLSSLLHLEFLNVEGCPVNNLMPLSDLQHIQLIRADGSSISSDNVKSFQSLLPECEVYYRTEEFGQWWDNLPISWKEALGVYLIEDDEDHAKVFAELIALESLKINEIKLQGLKPLLMFPNLKEISISNCGILNIQDLAAMNAVVRLDLSGNPIKDIGPLASMTMLEELSLKNTTVDDLEALSELVYMRKLHCNGTQIKKLDPLKGCVQLDELDCSGTRIRKLDALNALDLKKLIIFNTRVSEKRVLEFRNKHPECEVVFY